MFGQILAGLRADPRQDVKHPVRQARFAVNFRQLEGGERGDLARFENHRIAGGQRWRRFPQGDLDRVVPRADPGYHPQRFATGIDEGTVAQRDLATFQRRDQASVILQHVGAGDDIDGGGFAEGFTGIQRLQPRQLIVALAQKVDGATQDARAFHGGHRRPDFLPTLRAFNGAVDILASGSLNGRQHLASGRVDGLEGATAGGRCITTINIKLLFCHSGHNASSVMGSVNADE